MARVTGEQQIQAMQALNQRAAAWLVGMSPRSFRDAGAPRLAGGEYDAAALVEWVRGKATAVDGDPLLSGSDSPNLERYRAAKAELAEMDAAERRGQLVDIDQFQEWYAAEIALPIRRAIEALEHRHGQEAAAIIVKALAKSDATVEKRVG